MGPMALYFTVVTWAATLLLAATLASGLLSPPSLGVADSLHMPLGLLSLMGLLFVQSHFLSYLITTGWDVEQLAREGHLDREAIAEARALKNRSFRWVGISSLLGVTTGILGMGARALAVPGHVHAAFGLATLVSTGVAAAVETRVARENEAILARAGLSGGDSVEDLPPAS